MKIYTYPTSKKHTSEHPLPDLRPDLESQTNLGLEQTFNIFKNIQKHISSSVFFQGHSIRGHSSTQYVLNLVLQRGITVDLRNKTGDIATPLARRDHRNSKFGLRYDITLTFHQRNFYKNSYVTEISV
jgi:hypothetical protein